jgi:hypothetical protein
LTASLTAVDSESFGDTEVDIYGRLLVWRLRERDRAWAAQASGLCVAENVLSAANVKTASGRPAES